MARIWSRRGVLAGGAVLVAAPALGSGMTDDPAVGLVAAVNSGDAGAIAGWASTWVSAAGLRRRPPTEWARWLQATAHRSGRWTSAGSAPMHRAIRLIVRGEAIRGDRPIDLLFDREEPARIFDLRAAHEPPPYRGVLRPCEDTATLRAALRQRVAFAVATQALSGVVRVTDPAGVPVFEMAHGAADVMGDRPITTATRFNIGSSDKAFTAVLIGQMVEAGELDWNMRVAAVLPDQRDTPLGRPTIRQLLSHAGGLGEPDGGILAYSRDPYSAVSDLLPRLAATAPVFAPGERHAYSNEGFVLLGAVIERKAGKPFWAVLEQRIFRPAGMTQSGHPLRTAMPHDTATGGFHAREDLLRTGPLPGNSDRLPWRGNACGGGFCSAADITRFLGALRAGRLVSPAIRDALLAQSGQPHPGLDYGLGFVRTPVGGATWIGHSGGGVEIGIGAGMRTSIDSGWSAAVLTNRDVPQADALLLDILRLLPA